MPIIVQKYGGSSVADIEKLQRVADKVVAAKRAGNDVVVTVSAMGKTTDNLVSLSRQAAASEGRTGDPPRRELDMLVSTGERVSMALLSIAIWARGEEAISFTGSQSGIITNDRHFDARIIEVRPHRIEDELARGKIVIVAGYQGMSYKREITTLGRGGTDTTAVALAAARGAGRGEIYSDVDGVYSADPRVVPDAAHLPELDPTTLQEMAECGAKVLNAQAVEWAKKAKIAIYARSTFDPWEKGDGPRQTVVRPLGPDAPRAAAVVGESNLVLCRVSADGDAALERIAACSAEREIPIKDVSMRPDGGHFLVPLLNVPDWGRARASLEHAGGRALSIAEGLSAVSVVGDSLSTTGRPLAGFLACLREADARVHAVHASALRLSAVIDPAGSARAQQLLHARFCGLILLPQGSMSRICS
jgi:aspartate kinase